MYIQTLNQNPVMDEPVPYIFLNLLYCLCVYSNYVAFAQLSAHQVEPDSSVLAHYPMCMCMCMSKIKVPVSSVHVCAPIAATMCACIVCIIQNT